MTVETTIHVGVSGDIQAAIERVSSTGGGTVQLEPGVYTLRETLWMLNGVTLAGRGPATVLRCDTERRPMGIGTEQSELSNVTIRDLALVGPGRPGHMTAPTPNGEAGGPVGVFMNFETGKGRDIRLERLRVTLWECMGVHLKGVDGLTMTGCDFDRTAAFNGLYHNVYLRRTRNVQITHNLFRNNPVGNGFQASFSEHVLISNNRSIDNAGHGIRVAASTAVKIMRNTVLRNRGGAGIWLNCERRRDCIQVTVSDNVVRQNAQTGIAVQNTYASLVERNEVLGNGVDLFFRNARGVTMRQNRYRTTAEAKKNNVRFEENEVLDSDTP